MLPDSTRELLAAYLDSGQVYEKYRGYSSCRFGCGIDHSLMGANDLTDGKWVWPEGLSHYIRVHSVLLPQEFISWVTDRSPIPPASSEKHDFEFWISWGFARKDHKLRNRLRTAAHRHRLRSLNELRDLKRTCTPATPMEAKCHWSGCKSRAAAGKAFCEYHLVSPQAKREHLRGADVPLLSLLNNQ